VRYRCNEELVLAEGREYPAPPDDGFARWPRMAARECFANAAMLATRDDDLVYVEGFAVNIIPTGHAWCWSLSEGRVVDPTWGGGGREYFGVPFRTEFLSEALRARKQYGLLDDGRGGFPLLAGGIGPTDYRDDRAMAEDAFSVQGPR